MINVLFVCMGNICRSPTAQGVFERFVKKNNLSHTIQVDSAGLGDYHIGEAPDRRAQKAARRRGIDLSRQRARQVTRLDCEQFDYILAMDRWNYQLLQRLCPSEQQHKLGMFLDYAPQLGLNEVPDPYCGTQTDFEHVLDLVEAASIGLLQHIREENDL